jgi:phosphatidylserine/phosphatidylglycerophosphate/cardiolipin synthase-like enzyme
MKPSIKEKIYVAIIVVLIALCAQFYYSYRYLPKQERSIDVYYNQEHQLNREIISVIQEADRFVYFAVYTFTRQDIKDALLAAKYRGLEVKGVMDRKQNAELESQTKIFRELKEAGIPIFEQDHTGIMHLKTVVTDKAYASGSYNWTASATTLNDEVLEVGHDPDIRSQYLSVLESLFKLYQSQP